MVKIKELYDRITGKKFYPITSSEAVFCKNGENLERRLATDKEEIEAQMSNIISEPTDKALEAIEPGIIRDALRKNQQALTEAERKQVRINLGLGAYDATGAWVPQAFIDRWNIVFSQYGIFNISTRFFELNDITDIGYGEALKILELYISHITTGSILYYYHSIADVRTLLVHTISWSAINAGGCFRNNPKLKTLRFADASNDSKRNILLSNARGMFELATSLEAIYGIIYFEHAKVDTANMFARCDSLKNVSIVLQQSINLSHSRWLSLPSFKFMVANAINTSAITITVHADVYAKLTDETNTEWYQVLLDAADKNITFATV